MDSLTPFIVESVVLTFVALIVEGFSLRQVLHDLLTRERWRFLVASHYLTQVACLLFLIISLDSQGGLSFYSQATLLFLGNVKGMFLIASARALAAGFVDSHKLMTKGPQGPGAGWVLLVVHGVFLTLSIIFFAVLHATRNPWLGMSARCMICLYSLVVGAQVIVSAAQVRCILVAEHAKTGKYADGIRKLNRLMVLVAIILIIGNVPTFVGLSDAVAFAETNAVLAAGPMPFKTMHILSDFTSLLTHSMLLLGAWSTSNNTVVSSRKSTGLSTEVSRRLERANARDAGSTHSSAKEESVVEVGNP
jgi:hypothetical protein